MKNWLCKYNHPIVGDNNQKPKIENKSKRRFLQRRTALKNSNISIKFYFIYKLFPSRIQPV